MLKKIKASLVKETVHRAAPRRAAIACVLRGESDEELEVLFIRRALNPGDRWGGHVAFPGGKWEDGDASLRATAARETMEEIGLDLRPASFEYLGKTDDRMASREMAVSCHVFHQTARDTPRLAVNPSEVASAGWAKVQHVLDPANGDRVVVKATGPHFLYFGDIFGPIGFYAIRFKIRDAAPPAAEGEDYKLWGLTLWLTIALLDGADAKLARDAWKRPFLYQGTRLAPLHNAVLSAVIDGLEVLGVKNAAWTTLVVGQVLLTVAAVLACSLALYLTCARCFAAHPVPASSVKNT
ncbi:hypothetical protein DIPPA_02015 [Diplonema papillatum]|nr:hypothetical protein DIPPA_02015 [Diplonema papillatum]